MPDRLRFAPRPRTARAFPLHPVPRETMSSPYVDASKFRFSQGEYDGASARFLEQELGHFQARGYRPEATDEEKKIGMRIWTSGNKVVLTQECEENRW